MKTRRKTIGNILTFILMLFTYASFAQLPADYVYAKGGDISWYANDTRQFYDDNGNPDDLFNILADHCFNTIRIRVWYPENGPSGKNEVVRLAKRCYAYGFRIMIDFHYSDTWADPNDQHKPAAWEGMNVDQLEQAVYDHTYDVLNTLKNEGVTVEWVQVGNEIDPGMLLPEGSISNFGNLARFITSGHNAAKDVFPNIISIVHISRGRDNARFVSRLDGIINNGGQFDAIGMSCYPSSSDWSSRLDAVDWNARDLINRYNKPVGIVEIGLPVENAYEAREMVKKAIETNSNLPNNMGLGVLWWEPQAFGNTYYTKVIFDATGKPTIGLDGFIGPVCGLAPGVEDCNGTPGGTAGVDECGRCAGGTTGIYPCAQIEDGYYNITTSNNLCLSANNDFSQNNCNSSETSQVWKIEKSGENYKLYSITEEKYLSFTTAGEGADLGFAGTNNEFKIEQDPDGGYVIIAATNSNFVLDVPACAADVGLEMNFWSRLNNDCQTFSITASTINFDCAGTIDGSAYIDNCGSCVGGNTGIEACATIQLEQACSFDGTVDSDHTGFAGTGYVNLDNMAGSGLSIKVEAASSGIQTIQIQFANGSTAGRPCQILHNGEEVVASLDFPVTNAWTNWETVSMAIDLNKGVNEISIVSLTESGAANLDQLIVNANITLADCSAPIALGNKGIQLYEGWNLIGCPLNGTIEIETALQSIWNNVISVKDMDQFYVSSQAAYLNTLSELQYGKGYIVKVSQDCTLEW